MSENISFYQPRYPSHSRHRRRWLPKGVMLLAILFVVGLLGACHSPSQPVAAIAVPVDTTGRVDAVDDAGVIAVSNWIIESGQGGLPARRETVALNTF